MSVYRYELIGGPFDGDHQWATPEPDRLMTFVLPCGGIQSRWLSTMEKPPASWRLMGHYAHAYGEPVFLWFPVAVKAEAPGG